MDDDDILLPEACAQLSAPMEADLDLDFCCGRHMDFTHDPAGSKETRQPGYMRQSEPDELFPHLLDGCHVFQPGLMVRRRVYESIGPFREDLVRSQDYEMILRIARCHRGKQLHEVVFWHREHKGQRGQAGQQFDAEKAADRWAEYNARIFSELLATLAKEEVVPTQEWQSTPEQDRPRLALVARATIQARQRMWETALDDLEAACAASSDPLSEAELSRLRRATLSPLGTAPLDCDARLQQRLRRIGRSGGVGKSIRLVLRQSMRWQLRAAATSGDIGRIFQTGRFFMRS